MLNFFDCYAYLGLVHSDPIERFRVVQEAKRANVKHIVNVCNTIHDFKNIYESLSGVPQVLYAVGFAPSEAMKLPIKWETQLEEALKYKNVVAIGPIGLDYSRENINIKGQIELFVKQLDIARKYEKPVIIYNRDAGEDVKNILAQSGLTKPIIFHCYSESKEYALSVLRNFKTQVYFSFAGNITFKNSREIHRTLLQLPIERILIESTSPFLPPSLFTGIKNVPAHIFAVAEFIAELLDIDFEECSKILYENALKAFSISE